MPDSSHQPPAIITLVGPAEEEPARLADLAQALAVHEPGAELILVDDAPRGHAGRDLASLARGGGALRITQLRHPGHAPSEGWSSGNAVGLLTALAHIARHSQARAIVKMDTDALPIAPFAGRLLAALDQAPQAGLLGCCRIACEGGQRDTRHWARRMRALERPLWLLSRPCPPALRLRPAIAGGPARVRSVLADARSNGYAIGDNVMGGAFAIARPFVDAMLGAGDLEPQAIAAWRRTYLCDDVMIAPLCFARGFGCAEDHGSSGLFAVAWRGLPFPLDELAPRGYAIIHAVKNDHRHTEADIRAHFRDRRTP